MQAPQLTLHGRLDTSSLMVRVEVMTPCAYVGGAERADERVVVYNCTRCDCMLRVSIGPSLLDGLQKPYILLGALGAGEVIEGF